MVTARGAAKTPPCRLQETPWASVFSLGSHLYVAAQRHSACFLPGDVDKHIYTTLHGMHPVRPSLMEKFKFSISPSKPAVKLACAFIGVASWNERRL